MPRVGSSAGGRVGNGWVGDVRSPGTSLCGTSRSSMGQTGSPVTRSKTKTSPCLVSWVTASTRRPPMVIGVSIGCVGRS